MTTGTPDLDQLRRLLFGKEYDELLALKAQFASSEKYTASVARIIAEAISLRAGQDSALSVALAPMVEQSVTQSIQRQPQRFAEVLYPVMGPAIRKSIQQALNEALANLNYLLESSFSPQAWRWRFDAWRSGQSYAQVALLRTLVYQVEQAFLIHRETGLLLRHVLAENAISKAPDIVSGMLTAIQDFIKDSFAINGEDTLDTLRLGELTVLVEYGPHAISALVVRGTVPGELSGLLSSTSETIHRQYAHQFQAFNGDAAIFAGAETLLSDCLKAQRQHRQPRSPWLAYALLTTIVAAFGWWAYQHYQQQAGQLAQEAASKQQQHATLHDLQAQLRQQQTDSTAIQTSLQNLLEQQRQQAASTAEAAASNSRTIQQLTRQIETATYPFELAKAEIDLNHPVLQQISQDINALQQAARRNQQSLQVMLIGNTDDSGTEALNARLAKDRASNMRDALVRSGVPAALLVAYDANQPGLPATAHKSERGVSYRVTLY